MFSSETWGEASCGGGVRHGPSRARAGVGAWRWLVDGMFDEDVKKGTLRCGSSSRRTSPRAAMATQALAFCL